MWHNLNIKIKLKLQLSLNLVVTLEWYEKEGYLECNNFIENSIKNHIDYVKTGLGSDNTSSSVKVEVRIPILLAIKLWWTALIKKTSISNIVNEALFFSISCLMEQNQAQEDYRLEVELEE